MLRKSLNILAFLFLSVSVFSQEAIPQDTLALINDQAGLGKLIVIRLVESLNSRELMLDESEAALKLKEADYEQRMAELQQRETDLQGSEALQAQIGQISSDWQKSSTRLENSLKFTNKLLFILGTLCAGEAIILLVR